MIPARLARRDLKHWTFKEILSTPYVLYADHKEGVVVLGVYDTEKKQFWGQGAFTFDELKTLKKPNSRLEDGTLEIYAVNNDSAFTFRHMRISCGIEVFRGYLYVSGFDLRALIKEALRRPSISDPIARLGRVK